MRGHTSWVWERSKKINPVSPLVFWFLVPYNEWSQSKRKATVLRASSLQDVAACSSSVSDKAVHHQSLYCPVWGCRYCICATLWRQMHVISCLFSITKHCRREAVPQRQQLMQFTLTEASFTSADKLLRCCLSECTQISEEISWHLKHSNGLKVSWFWLNGNKIKTLCLSILALVLINEASNF